MELVEREAELAVLRDLLGAARAGAGGFRMLEATAGHGKTALVRQLREEARADG